MRGQRGKDCSCAIDFLQVQHCLGLPHTHMVWGLLSKTKPPRKYFFFNHCEINFMCIQLLYPNEPVQRSAMQIQIWKSLIAASGEWVSASPNFWTTKLRKGLYKQKTTNREGFRGAELMQKYFRGDKLLITNLETLLLYQWNSSSIGCSRHFAGWVSGQSKNDDIPLSRECVEWVS